MRGVPVTLLPAPPPHPPGCLLSPSQVGLLTGDVSIKPESSCLVGWWAGRLRLSERAALKLPHAPLGRRAPAGNGWHAAGAWPATVFQRSACHDQRDPPVHLLLTPIDARPPFQVMTTEILRSICCTGFCCVN